MIRTWAASSAAVLVLVVALSGCGSDEGSEATDAPTAPASTAATSRLSASDPTRPATGECPYLAAEQVTAALGAPTQELAGTLNACFFDPEDAGEGPGVMVSKIDIAIDPTDYASQSRGLCIGDVTDVDAGDVAFACVGSMGPIGQLYVDRVLVTISVTDAADDATGVAAAATLLPQITIP